MYHLFSIYEYSLNKLVGIEVVFIVVAALVSHSLCHRRDDTLGGYGARFCNFNCRSCCKLIWWDSLKNESRGFFFGVVPENYKLVRLNHQHNSWHQTVQNHLMPGTVPVLILLTSTGPWLSVQTKIFNTIKLFLTLSQICKMTRFCLRITLKLTAHQHKHHVWLNRS